MNSVVGDLDGNRDAHPRAARAVAGGRRRPRPLPRARRHRLSAGGPAAAARRSSARPAARSSRSPPRRGGIVALVGAPHLDADLSNACYVLAGRRDPRRLPQALPAELRRLRREPLLRPGHDLLLLRFGDVVVGPTICEDIWQPGPPATDLALAGAQLVVNISASPFHVGKDREREEMLRVRARDNSCFIALCNTVGGQDELIFDGHSLVLDDEGELVARRRELRGGAARGRRRPGGCGRPPPARRAAARARARARHGTRPRRARARAARGPQRRAAAARRRPSRSTTSSRCASRSSSGCATTCARTASATS